MAQGRSEGRQRKLAVIASPAAVQPACRGTTCHTYPVFTALYSDAMNQWGASITERKLYRMPRYWLARFGRRRLGDFELYCIKHSFAPSYIE